MTIETFQGGDPGDEQVERCAFVFSGERRLQCCLPLGHLAQHETEGLPECCYTPMQCAGKTSCPKNPACSS